MIKFLKPNRLSISIAFIIFIFVLVFTRFFNLDNTARFIWDESSDLVRMHQYYVEKKLTLIGPINESGDRVYGSLTYYMLLPFSILGQFDPVSPVWGTAFWGVITALLLIFLTKKLNPRYTLLVAILTLVWFPLVETSRWAWNPNLIPFWITLGIILFLRNTHFSILISGFFWGLTTHHHYLSLFTLLGFFLGIILLSIREKYFWKPVIWAFGVISTLIPFVIFDLRHPPGLFLTKILYNSPIQTHLSTWEILDNAWVWLQYMLNYYTQSPSLSIALGIIILLLLAFDIKSRFKGLIFAFPFLIQVIGLSFIDNPGPIYYYYLLPSTIPFLVWVLYPRRNQTKFIAGLALVILLIGGATSIVPKLTQTTWQTDIKSVRKINSILSKEITTKELKNVNIAVLESPDNNTYGRRYRDLLLLQNINLKTKDEYSFTDHLFIVSTGSEQSLRKSPAFEMHNFRSGTLVDMWTIDQSSWKLYHFTRNITPAKNN